MKKYIKYFILALSTIVSAAKCYCQKPLVNDTTYKSWTTVENGALSPDGKYAYYRIANEPIGGNTWVILSTDNRWQIRSTTYENLNFSPDSKYLFAMQGDSLVKIKLNSNTKTIIRHCKRYELYESKNANWLIYTLDDPTSQLIAENLRTGIKKVQKNIFEYSISQSGASIVSKIKTPNLETIQWTELGNDQSVIIYTGTPCRNLIFDPSGSRIAFDITNQKGQTEIWYYQRGWKTSKLIASDTTIGIAENLKITTSQTWRFSEDGQDLFFNLTAKDIPQETKVNGPDIWNYNDLYLLPEYKKISGSIHYGENFSILNVASAKIRQLLSGSQKIVFESIIRKNSNVFIVQSSAGKLDELSWNKKSNLSYFLCFTKTGKLIPIKENCNLWLDVMALSPDNNFLVYYDPEKLQYVSYELKTGESKVISQTLKAELYSFHFASRAAPGVREGTFGIAAWVEGKTKIIVHGMYDLWEFDLQNKVAPINLTNGVGEANQLMFSKFESPVLNPNTIWTLGAFNIRTKDKEIYSYNYKSHELKFKFRTASDLAGGPIDPPRNIKKANNANSYLIKLGNAQASPNYVYTTDFHKLDTISNNYPEKRYNWLTTQLINYKDPFGRECQGVLYKPENFDSLKKHPVIFSYYIESANHLNQTIDLDPNYIGVNIPILVSSGYLVCLPNIYLEVDRPGDAALTSVSAAADYMKKFSWTDSSKMGIVGHSRGGYETNYIITHSNRFAAAISAAGISNLIEYYNGQNLEGGESNYNYVRSQMLMTNSLEENVQKYNENSPNLFTKNVSTPLLLIHNEGDLTVSSTQSKEFFIQLRSQKKPVWLVQYEGENHIIGKLENQIDFQNKLKGFFDHYLKNDPLPQWMNDPIK